MTDQITQLLNQVDALDQETTPGPWQITETDDCDSWQIAHVRQLGQSLAIAEHRVVYLEGVDADAEFIAISRTALPKLARAITEILAFVEFAEKTHTENDQFDLAVRSSIRAIKDAIKNGMEDTND